MALSRRHLFRLATFAAGAVGSATLASYAPAQENSHPQNPSSAGKPPKQAVGYQDQPNGQQRCSTCANFVAPSDCRVVAGPVSAAGWCHLYQAKSP
jgi:hypothetical protein